MVTPGRALRPLDGLDVLGEGAPVDQRAAVVGQVGDVAVAQRRGLAQEVVAHPLPHRMRDERPRRRRALLPLVVEGAANQRGAQHIRPRRGVRDHEVLAAGLADQPRIAVVAVDIGADLLPQVLEGGRRSGEVDAGQPRVGQRHVGNREAVAGDQVDHPGRQPRGLEQLHRQVGRQGLRDRRLPHDGVAHQRRRGRQVAGDRGEVERRDRVDESVQRAVVAAIPFPGPADRLLRQDLARERHVEAPEVDLFAGRVDLGLVGGLGLAEHGRGGDLLPPRPGQQIGGPQEYRRALVERHCRPGVLRGHRGVDRRRRIGVDGVGQGAQLGGVPVRLDDVDAVTVTHPVSAADDVREVDRVVGQRDQFGAQPGCVPGIAARSRGPARWPAAAPGLSRPCCQDPRRRRSRVSQSDRTAAM